jgi:hypothetical protein
MTRRLRQIQPATNYEHQRRVTAGKLGNALDGLLRGVPEHPSLRGRPYRLTVATLAREAGVGRCAIYTNHRGILEEFAAAGKHRAVPHPLAALHKKLAQQRSVIAAMQLQLRRLATENAGLLRRAVEAEQRAERADRRKRPDGARNRRPPSPRVSATSGAVSRSIDPHLGPGAQPSMAVRSGVDLMVRGGRQMRYIAVMLDPTGLDGEARSNPAKSS